MRDTAYLESVSTVENKQTLNNTEIKNTAIKQKIIKSDLHITN